MKNFTLCLSLTALFLSLQLCATDPVWKYTVNEKEIILTAEIPPGVYFYKDRTFPKIFEQGKSVVPSVVPETEMYKDEFSGESKVYSGPGSFSWVFRSDSWKYPLLLKFFWQGCSKPSKDQPGSCFLPGLEQYKLERFIPVKNPKVIVFEQSVPEIIPQNHANGNSLELPPFEIIRSESGYMGAPQFMEFLKGEKKELFLSFAGKSFPLILLLVFLGGIALNFTPCVLPMIPVNLAIIGARTGSRGACMVRGLIYGAGIALAYGILGIAVVMTGSTFGVIDSSCWFNALVSLIFLILGLSLFDLFILDFSRYGGGIFRKLDSARYAGIFLMGALAALLAGACVAPVVVAALIQAGKMYNSGEHAGLFLPLVLGLGMACPWPLAAGGFSVMPKPGLWMKYVKYVFGVVIIGMGMYYGYLAVRIGFSGADSKERLIRNRQILTDALTESAMTGKPVLLDFRADWCKNCVAMEKSTFTDPQIVTELKNFIFVKFDATDISNPQISSVLKQFSVSGLPAYLIVKGVKNPVK